MDTGSASTVTGREQRGALVDMVVEVCSGGSLHFHFLSEVGWRGEGVERTEERRGVRSSFGRMAETEQCWNC